MTSTAAASIRAKIARGLQHLLELDDRVGAYLDSEPLTIRREVSEDGRQQVFVLKQVKPPGLLLSILVGEVVHQLRSAVDHIAPALVLSHGGQPTTRTAFPVLVTRPTQLRIAGGVSSEALRRIEDFQPYLAPIPDEHPLSVLTQLWNIDKHRSLHLTAVSVRHSQIFLASPDGSAVVGGQLQATALRDNNVIGVFRFEEAPDPETEVAASGQTFVALDESGPWPRDEPVTVLLERLHQYVALTLLPAFEPLL